MRKFWGLSFILILAMVFMADFAYAKPVEKVGKVNLQKILSEYKDAESVNNKLQKEKDALQEKLDKEQELIKSKKEKYEKAPKMSETEKEKATKELNKDLTKLQDSFQKFSEELRDKQASAYKGLEEKIMKAITAVAAAEQLDVVVESNLVYVGGIDVTEKVIEKLNGGKSTKKSEE